MSEFRGWLSSTVRTSFCAEVYATRGTPENNAILHVDDDVAMLHLVSNLLREKSYEITSTSDPRQAIARVISWQHRVVLHDVDRGPQRP